MTMTVELLRNTVKEKLARNELVTSMIVRLVRSVEVASIARTAGFDSIYIDLEHSSISLDTAGQICMSCLPLHIESARDAAAIVRAVKFPPAGDRPYAGASPQLHFRTLSTTETYKILNDAAMVITMIESADAVKQVDEIAAVPGVDILLIGTNDLCNSLGIAGQLDHQSVRDVYSRTFEACTKHGKHLGIAGLSSRPALVEEFVKLGARYVSVGSDVAFLLGGAASKVTQLKALKTDV